MYTRPANVAGTVRHDTNNLLVLKVLLAEVRKVKSGAGDLCKVKVYGMVQW